MKETTLAKQDFSRSIHTRQLTHNNITISYLTPNFYKYDYHNRRRFYWVQCSIPIFAFIILNIWLVSIDIGLAVLISMLAMPVLLLLLALVYDINYGRGKPLAEAKLKYKFTSELETIRQIIKVITYRNTKELKIEYVDMLGYKKEVEFQFGHLTKQEVYNDGSKPASEFWDITSNYMEWCK